MDGYSKENTLNQEALKQIPLFLKLREMVLFSAVYRSFDFDEMSPWWQEKLKFMTHQIRHDLPFLDMDF
jgi:Ser/Thr protein kinase RdoA (MazF antagonist)